MRRPPFRDREEAGQKLAEQLSFLAGESVIVLAIPRGGVPVGYEVARAVQAPLEVITPRKLPIPWDPEAGFGAITPDGTLVLNAELVKQLGLRRDLIEGVAAKVQAEVRRREAVYRGHRPFPDLKDKVVLLIDDGLASGYTMIAAVQSVRKHQPAKVTVAVPCSPKDSLGRVARVADQVVALVVKDSASFAVADFYGRFPDLTDAQVLGCLHRAHQDLKRAKGIIDEALK